jgi:hypothetical protein
MKIDGFFDMKVTEAVELLRVNLCNYCNSSNLEFEFFLGEQQYQLRCELKKIKEGEQG